MATTLNKTISYVGTASSTYVGRLFFAPNSLQYFQPHTEVRKAFKLRVGKTSGLIQSYSCDPTPSGTITLSEKSLDPKKLIIATEVCKSDLEQTWSDDQANALFTGKKLPKDFMEFLMNEMISTVGEQVEKLAWIGYESGSTGIYSADSTLTEINGIHTLAYADSDTRKITGSAISGSNALSELDRVFNRCNDIVKGNPKTKIFVSPNVYFAYQTAKTQIAPSNPNYNVEVKGVDTFRGIPIILVYGLNASKIIMTHTDNLHYATNLYEDYNQVKVIDYSESSLKDIVAQKMVFSIAVGYANSDEVVVYGTPTMAA